MIKHETHTLSFFLQFVPRSPSPAYRRRARDSNPRLGITQQRFSRPPHSATMRALRRPSPGRVSLAEDHRAAPVPPFCGPSDDTPDGDRHSCRMADAKEIAAGYAFAGAALELGTVVLDGTCDP